MRFLDQSDCVLEAGGDVESLHKPIYQKDGQEIRLMDKLPEKEREEDKILNHMLLSELLYIVSLLPAISYTRSCSCTMTRVPSLICVCFSNSSK